MIVRSSLNKFYNNLLRFLTSTKLSYINISSIVIYLVTSTILGIHLYFIDEELFRILLIEFGYGLILFFPYWIFIRIFIKLKFQRNLYLVLASFAGFSALFTSMMTKITPNWGNLRSDLLFISMMIIIGLLNLISMINLTVYFTGIRIINPFRQVISQKERIEDELMKQKKELSVFTHVMVHDIRTNLSSIKGYAQLMKRNHNEDYPQIIIDQVDHLNSLLKSSLKLADAGKLIDKKENVDLTVLSRDVVELIVPKDIKVNYGILPSSILADSRRLFQVWKNIIENALTHGNPSKIEIYSQKVDGMCQIYLENNGSPFPKDIVKNFHQNSHIFDSPNKGLGLQIIKRIISAHSWKITIGNNPNPRIIIQIPLNEVKY